MGKEGANPEDETLDDKLNKDSVEFFDDSIEILETGPVEKPVGPDDETLLDPAQDVTKTIGDVPKTIPEPISLTEAVQTEGARYEIVKRLGEGGMGAVYLAKMHTPRFSKDIALKVTHKTDAHTVERFDREAGAMASFNDPGIPQVYDSGTLPDGTMDNSGQSLAGKPYIAMELAKGQTLDRLMNDTNLSIDKKLEIFSNAANTLHNVHEKGYVHRDLKPENIIVYMDGNDVSRVFIMDLGLAKDVSEKEAQHKVVLEKLKNKKSNLTQDDAVLGSVPWMAPEQMEGSANVDARADVFALGTILYEMLTGERFRNLDNLYNIIAKATVAGEPVEARKKDPRIPKDVESLLRKALTKKPEDRYQYAADLRDDAEAARTKGIVSSHDYNILQRKWRSASPRQKAAATLLSLLLPVAGGLGTVAGFALNEANKAKTEQAQAEVERLREQERQNTANDLIRKTKFTYDVHKNFDKYSSGLEEAVKTAPSWSVPRFELGMAHYEVRNFEEAIAEFEKASELRQKATGRVDAQALFMAAMTAIDQSDRPDIAGKFTDKVLKQKVDENDPYARLCRSISAFNEGDMDAAIAEAEAVTEETAKVSEAFYLLSMYHSWGILSQFHDDKLKLYKDHKKALELITQAIESNDRRWRYFNHRAFLDSELGHFERALTDVNKSIDLIGLNRAHIVSKASILNRMQDYRGALDFLIEAEKKVTFDFDHFNQRAATYLNLADSQKRKNNLDEAKNLYHSAETDLRKALAEKETFKSHSLLGAVLQNLGRSEEGLRHHDRAIELAPVNPEPFISRGIAYRNTKQYDKAIADFDKAEELGSPLGFYHRGIAYGAAGKVDKAIAQLEEHLKRSDYDKKGISGYLQQLKNFRDKRR